MKKAADQSDWIYQLLSDLDALPTDPVLQQCELVAIQQGLPTIIQFVLSNKDLLVKMGRNGFKDFLTLWEHGEEEEAFNSMLVAMGPDELVRRFNANADELKRINDDWDAFCVQAEKFVVAIGPVVIKILLAILVV